MLPTIARSYPGESSAACGSPTTPTYIYQVTLTDGSQWVLRHHETEKAWLDKCWSGNEGDALASDVFGYMAQMDVETSNIEDVDRCDYEMDDHLYWTKVTEKVNVLYIQPRCTTHPLSEGRQELKADVEVGMCCSPSSSFFHKRPTSSPLPPSTHRLRRFGACTHRGFVFLGFGACADRWRNSLQEKWRACCADRALDGQPQRAAVPLVAPTN